MWFIILVLSVLCGFLYRLGGAKPSDFLWMPKWLIRSWVRDWLCPLPILISVGLLHGWHWSMIISYGLIGAALTTYKYGLSKPPDYLWYHYSLHGFMVSLAIFPYVIFMGGWISMILRCVASAILLGLWSLWKEVNIEEGGRGFWINATILFFK